ncbi:rhodanese-like domain-containing protein [Sphingobacterium sp. FBM7-1]|uniref:rhodanese-like domain-containing protein n=2 Tax=Sphingobacterium TaxID=28453 RepID=UPI001D1252A6|nr:rhodanese-like domain-containing protein [Sphingobacterium sp. FBM7-1]MCC2599420.1 rhodanese-like domain-containing protein [Sphingobacterium sp. FBM7-1]
MMEVSMNGKSWGINWLANSSVILIIIVMLSIFKGIFSNDDTALKEVLVKNNPQLIDVRTPLEFNGGTVKGAKNIPLSELESKLGSLDKSKNIVVFCQSGNRSGQAMRILQNKGFEKVHNGGGWRALKSLVESI